MQSVRAIFGHLSFVEVFFRRLQKLLFTLAVTQTMNSLTFVTFLLCTIAAFSFKLSKFNNVKLAKSLSFDKLAVQTAAATLLMPTICSADEGSASAVLVPLGISIFTMVPFIWYQQ